jgi:hypothetical protein
MDGRRNAINDHKRILHTFVAHYMKKYGPIEIDGRCVKEILTPTVTSAYAAFYEQPITIDEIITALKIGGRNKLQGATESAWNFIQHIATRYKLTSMQS